MDIAITRMSSKGQVVIPAEMRKDMEVGEKILIIRDNGHLIMKRVKDLADPLKEDLEFAQRTEAALKRWEKGNFTRMESQEFLDELTMNIQIKKETREKLKLFGHKVKSYNDLIERLMTYSEELNIEELIDDRWEQLEKDKGRYISLDKA